MTYWRFTRVWGSSPPTWIGYRNDGREVICTGSEPSILTEFDMWWHETRMKHDLHYRRRVEGRIQDIGECKMHAIEESMRELFALSKGQSTC